jgi:endoplasmic reticulum Man9GlcNAc2 1,2-alpha-mannosidase
MNSSSDSWQAAGRPRHHAHESESHGLSEKVAHIFQPRKDSLPMYKDKPYNYQKSNRKWTWWVRRRRTPLGLALLCLGLWSYWTGIMSPLAMFTGSSRRVSLTWLLGEEAEVINWEDRAERVKDAFKISFAGYEKYAWGRFH